MTPVSSERQRNPLGSLRLSRTRSFFFLATASLVLVTCTGSDVEPDVVSSTTTTAAPTTTDTTEPVDDDSIDGGTFKVGLTSRITTDNWFASRDTQVSSSNQFLASSKLPLYSLSLPGFIYIPRIAATGDPIAASQDGEVWVVEQPIRDDLIWSDGEPLTAADLEFYFSVTREFRLGGSHATSFPSTVSNVTAVEDHLVRVEFESEPRLLDWQMSVGLASFVPSHFWGPFADDARAAAAELADEISDADVTQLLIDISVADENPETDLVEEDITLEDIVGYREDVIAEEARTFLYSAPGAGEPSVGPFIVGDWEPGTSANSLANESYLDRGTEFTLYSDGSLRVANEGLGRDELYGGSGQGEVVATYGDGPFPSEIKWIEYADREEAYEALAVGELDYVLDPSGISNAVRDQLAVNPEMSFSTSQAEGFRYLAFNLRKAPLSDLAFREAIGTVVDKELVTDTVLAGAAFSAYTVIHPELMAHYNPEVVRPGWTADGPMSKSDRFQRAIQILEERGYTWEIKPVIDPEQLEPVVTPGSGLTMPNGTQVPELTLLAPGPSYDPLRSTFSEWIVKWMNELGIPVIVEQTDFEAIISRVFPPQTEETAQSWDLYVLGWRGAEPALPGTSMVGYFHSSEDAVTGGGLNTTGYSSDEFDEAAQAFLEATDLATALEMTKKMEEIVARDLPYVVLFRGSLIEAYNSKVLFPVETIIGGHAGYPGGWPSAVQLDG